MSSLSVTVNVSSERKRKRNSNAEKEPSVSVVREAVKKVLSRESTAWIGVCRLLERNTASAFRWKVYWSVFARMINEGIAEDVDLFENPDDPEEMERCSELWFEVQQDTPYLYPGGCDIGEICLSAKEVEILLCGGKGKAGVKNGGDEMVFAVYYGEDLYDGSMPLFEYSVSKDAEDMVQNADTEKREIISSVANSLKKKCVMASESFADHVQKNRPDLFQGMLEEFEKFSDKNARYK